MKYLLLLLLIGCAPAKKGVWVKMTSTSDSVIISDVNIPELLQYIDSVNNIKYFQLMVYKNRQMDSMTMTVSTLNETIIESRRREGEIIEAKNRQLDSLNTVVQAQATEISMCKGSNKRK